LGGSDLEGGGGCGGGGGGGGGGVLGLELRRHGGNAVWNSKCMGGFSSEFLEGGDSKSSKASLEITDLIIFPVCKSSTN